MAGYCVFGGLSFLIDVIFSVKSVKFVWDKYLAVFRNRPFDQCGFNPHQNHSISGRKKHVPMWLVPVIVAYSWLHDFNNIDSLHHCHHIWNGGNGAPRQERCPSGHLARWVSWVPWRYFFGPQSWFSNGFNGFDGKCIGKFMINEGFCENQTILDVLKLIFSFMGSPLYLGIYGEYLFYLGGSLSKSKFPWKDKLWMIWGSPIFGWKRWGDQFVINHRWVCPFGVTLV